MLQIKNLNLTHKKDLRVILSEFNLVLNSVCLGQNKIALKH